MPVLIAAIGGMLINLVGTLAGRVLIALGLSVVTYTGINSSLDWLKAGAVSAIGGMSPEVASLIGYLKVGQCISIVTSAILARAVINGISGDSFKKWVLR